MYVGVISDTHDNVPMIKKATSIFRKKKVEHMIHAGDFVAPFSMEALLEPGIPFIGVFGNNDGERKGLSSLCDTLYEPPHRFELGGRTIVLTHDPEALTDDATADAHVVIHGHTHGTKVEEGPPLVLNPGEAGGWVSGRCTVAFLDLDSLQVELIDLEDGGN